MKFDIAIEIGGANTSIYRKDYGLALKEPTLVAAVKTMEGYQIKAIGEDAKKMLGKTDESVEVFSPVTNGAISSFEYAVFMLKSFFEKVEIKKPSRHSALVIIPCGLTATEKDNYVKLMYECGVRDVRLIPSVIAAAVGCGKNISGTNATLLCDIGGMTTDVAIMNLNGIIKGASICIGGKLMDVAITNMIAYNYGIVIGISTAEKLKTEIGSLYDHDTSNMEITGIDAITKSPKTCIITSDDIKLAIEPFFEELIKTVETTVNLTPPDVTSDVVQTGLLITGGASKLAGLEKYLRKRLQIPVTIPENSENAAILGAGKLLSSNDLLFSILKEV